MNNEKPSEGKMDISAVLAQMDARQGRARARLTENKDRILEALKRLGATRVEADYEGSGDDGSINEVSIFKGDSLIKTSDTITVLAETSMFDPEIGKWVDRGKQETVPLAEAISDLIYDWLEGENPGWEINDGSSGDFEIDVATGEFSRSHNVYYTESTTWEYSL